MADKWWLNLKAGDRFFVIGDRAKSSGMAEVYNVAKKYIYAHKDGRCVKVVKSTGCTEDYPFFMICKDEEDHRNMVEARQKFRDAIDGFNALLRVNDLRITRGHASDAQALYRKIIGDSDD